MTKISQYSVDNNIGGNDKWIGSDAQNYQMTKNFTPNNLANYFNNNNVIDIGTSIRYTYQTLDPGEDREQGTISFETEIGAQVNFSDISTFLLAKRTLKNNIVTEYLDFLVDSKVVISKSSNINIFGYYKITSIEPWLTDTNFFVVTVEFFNGNGFIYEDLDYLISLVDKVQDVPPPVWGSITGDIEDQTDLINYISSQIITPSFSEVLAVDNTTDGNLISISDGDYIILDNGSKLIKGTTDSGNGGLAGIALRCSLDYELKWDAGRLFVMEQDGFTIREVSYNFTDTPTATDDQTKGYIVGSRWILDNGDVYECTDDAVDDAVWELQLTDVQDLENVLSIGNESITQDAIFRLDTDKYLKINRASQSIEFWDELKSDLFPTAQYSWGGLEIRWADGSITNFTDGFNQIGFADGGNIEFYSALISCARASGYANLSDLGIYIQTTLGDLVNYNVSSIVTDDGTYDLPDGASSKIATLLDIPTTGYLPKTTASGTDTYIATVTGVIAYNDGDAYLVRFTNGNTTTATLNINALGAKTLYRNNDGALLGGDIWDGAEMLCIYNSSLNAFQCIGTSPNALFAYVTNDDSVSITKGMPVYAFSGTGDRMTVKRALNTSDATSAQTVGVVASTSIASGQKGIIIVQGLLDGLSILPTATWTDGDPVYLGATAGAITNVKPYAPNHLVYLGVVTTASNGSSGRMYVRVQNGYELDELHNVQAQSPSNKNGIFYNSTSGLWEARAVAATDIDSNVSNTEFGYLDGVTSAIQTQLNLKQYTLHGLWGTIATWADATTYYFPVIGGLGALLKTATTGLNYSSANANTLDRIYMQVINIGGTVGTSENVSLYYRNITASTSTLIGTFQTNITSNSASVFDFTSIGISIPANTDWCLEIRTPTWTTNPTQTLIRTATFLTQ